MALHVYVGKHGISDGDGDLVWIADAVSIYPHGAVYAAAALATPRVWDDGEHEVCIMLEKWDAATATRLGATLIHDCAKRRDPVATELALTAYENVIYGDENSDEEFTHASVADQENAAHAFVAALVEIANEDITNF